MEILAVVGGYLLYGAVRALTEASPQTAMRHARGIIAAEPAFVTAFERWLNDVSGQSHALVVAMGYYYTTFHFVLTPAVLAWAWWARPTYYARARSVLFAMSLGSLLVFWLFPVAPPRFAVPGAVDLVISGKVFGVDDAHGVSGLVNAYAAVPSLHVGWAAWCAWVVVGSFRSRWRHLAWLYPAATTFVVVATANHFIFDAVAGVMTLVVATCLMPPPAVPLLLTEPVPPPRAGGVRVPVIDLSEHERLNADADADADGDGDGRGCYDVRLRS